MEKDRRGARQRRDCALHCAFKAPGPSLHRAEQNSRVVLGRSLSPTINSGISFPSSGSQRGHSEGAGAERRGRRKGKEHGVTEKGGGGEEERKQADIDREGEAVIGITAEAQPALSATSRCMRTLTRMTGWWCALGSTVI